METILVVDDEPAVGRALSRLLRRFGFNTICAQNNRQAFEAISKHIPDLIISDVNRSGGGGVEFVSLLKAHRRTSPIPVIICSATLSEEVELRLRRKGVRAFLDKPVMPEDVITELNRTLRRHYDPADALLHAGEETITLDYKLTIDIESKTERAELAKDVIAMANAGGGTIVVGVGESTKGYFDRVGVTEPVAAKLETTRLGDALQRYVGSSARATSRRVERYGRTFIFIRIEGVEDTLALAAAGNENAGLYPGRIYVRTHNARSTELTDPLELSRLVDSLVDARLRKIRNRPPGSAHPIPGSDLSQADDSGAGLAAGLELPGED